MAIDRPDDTKARVERSRDPNVPKLYVNGFINTLGTSDIMTILERNGEPIAVLNMSYTVAKTLATSLGEIVARLEELSGRDMLTTKQLESMFLQEVQGSHSDD